MHQEGSLEYKTSTESDFFSNSRTDFNEVSDEGFFEKHETMSLRKSNLKSRKNNQP
jgi:hypothetical protein